MSRVGKQPIQIPSGVTITVDDSKISVNGSKGSLEQMALPGLMRTLLNNMVVGVSKGFEKKLEINGVGYRVAMQGADLKFNLGFSHDVIYKVPQGINVAIEQNILTVSGIAKQQVGQVAAEIRALKKPEPYKGKGIKYVDERIIRKSGKSGKE
jgi:large subunit ribosomal protein L6